MDKLHLENHVDGSEIPSDTISSTRCGPDGTKTWTPERDKLLRDLWLNSKKSASEIGDQLGISRSAVIGRCHRNGLSRSGPRKPPQPFTAAEEAQFREMWRAGASARQIGKRLGVSEPIVWKRSKAMGLQSRRGFNVARAKAKRIQPSYHRAATSHIACVGIGFMDLQPHQCKWVLDEKRDGLATYCGLPVFPERPYCTAHCKLAYQPVEPVYVPQHKAAA